MEEQIERIKELLEGLTIGTITITNVKTNSTGVLLNVLDTGTEMWDRNYLTKFYHEMYRRITDELGPEVTSTVEIGNYIINAGITGAELNIFSANHNVMPAFTRHQFVLPVVIKDIPGHIHTDHFSIPSSTPNAVAGIMKSLLAQRNVPNKLNHMFTLFKEGTMEVKTNENSLHTTKVSYKFPDSTRLVFETQPGLNYKIRASIVNNDVSEHVMVHIIDCEDFKQKTENILDKLYLKMEFDRELLRAFEKHALIHKLRLSTPLPMIHQMIRITGCKELNRDKHDRY